MALVRSRNVARCETSRTFVYGLRVPVLAPASATGVALWGSSVSITHWYRRACLFDGSGRDSCSYWDCGAGPEVNTSCLMCVLRCGKLGQGTTTVRTCGEAGMEGGQWLEPGISRWFVGVSPLVKCSVWPRVDERRPLPSELVPVSGPRLIRAVCLMSSTAARTMPTVFRLIELTY